MRNRLLTILTAFFLFSPLFAGEVNDSSKAAKDILYSAQKFKYILGKIHENYVDSLDIQAFSDRVFDSMLKELGTGAEYYTAEERQKVKDRDKGSTIGIGANCIPIDDTLTVIYIAHDSPAEREGLLAGDKVIYLEGKSAIGLDHSSAMNRIKGDSGSHVSMVVKRGYESGLRDFSIERAVYPISSINSYFIIAGTDIGFIHYNRFSKSSLEEFMEIVPRLKRRGMKKMILDFRGNPGGFLKEACSIADQFLEADKTIAYTEARNPIYRINFGSTEDGCCKDVPLVVVLDENSASASEAFAGAIQDLDRGMVIGQQSYGKGSAQKIWDINDGSAFKFTIAHYHTPSGRKIESNHKDKEVELDESLKLSAGPKSVESIENALKATGGATNLPVFTTEKGRPVIGGGGIYPDFIVREDTTTILTRVLNKKAIILGFAYHFIHSERENLLKKYDKELDKFIGGFSVSEKMLKDFEIYSKSRKIWNEEMFQRDKEMIKTIIKAKIAEAVWGNNGFKAVMITNDKTIDEAIRHIPEAELMLK